MPQFNFTDQSYSAYNDDGLNFMRTNGPVMLLALPGTEDFVSLVDHNLHQIRLKTLERYPFLLNNEPGFIRSSFIGNCEIVRFSSGEAKATLHSSVRGHDVYIFCDVTNHFFTYKMFDLEMPMSPDDHYQNLKRAILACSNKAKSVSVIMPYIYEGRQDSRNNRESLDAANVLKELNSLGVKNIICFDAHEPRIENAIPMQGIENIPTSYNLLEALITDHPETNFSDPLQTVIISPDENGMKRATYYASMLGLSLGTFYRQRNPQEDTSFRDPEAKHKFLGEKVAGKTAIIIDDMINSGLTVIETAKRLKLEEGAKNIIVLCTYPLFTSGIAPVQEAVDQGLISKIYGTNLCAHYPELKEKAWYRDVDLSLKSAELIDALNHQASISAILDQSDRIAELLKTNAEQQSFLQHLKKDS